MMGGNGAGGMAQNVADLSTEQAVRLWTRRNSGTWTEADEAHLQKWLATAPEHRAAYDKVARAWAITGGLGAHLPRGTALPRPNRRLLVWAGAALTAVLLVGLGLGTYTWWNGTPTQWIVQRGETRSIVLDDGTRIVLDGGSELETRIGARTRRVSLRRGEALITVAHDSSRLFEVDTGLGRISDLGTRFDVENLQGVTRVSVLEGRVEVSTPRGESFLEAGRAGGYDGAGTLLPVRAADNSVAAWPDGRRHFDGDRLSEVLERLARRHAVTFVFADPQLRELRVSGTFRMADLSLFLRTLQAALPVETRWIDSQRIELSPRAGTSGNSAQSNPRQ
jgi:transmembrane sensor